MPNVVLGSDDFEKHRNEFDVYVDKSLFLKELIDDKTDVLLITRPRRFGKSLNLSMVKYFFEKNKKSKASLFTNLKIWKTGEEYRLEQGKYPIVYMSLKEVDADDWEQCFIGLKNKIAEVFKTHKKIKTCLDCDEQSFFEGIESRRASQKEFELSLRYLLKWLERYHKEKTMILMDEYDSPINRGYTMGYKEKIISFMRNFLGAAMKTNPSLKKAILSGVTRIAGESLFSGLNNFRSYSVLDEEYSDCFGFTQAETKWVLSICNVAHDFSEIKKWYNGYIFGNTKDIYNPWSIMNVAKTPQKVLKSYWINSGSDSIIKDQLAKATIEIKEVIYAMIQGEKIRLPVIENVTYDDLIEGSDGLWSFLLYAGYLTAENRINSEDEESANYLIPNNEVRKALKLMIAGWLKKGVGSSLGITAMLNSMMSGNVDDFSQRLSHYVSSSFSYFDTTNKQPELVYHAFILGLLAHLDSNYYFNSNPEAGQGRADILIMTKLANYPKNATILEFKKARKKEDLAEKTQIALNQIKTKGYAEEAKKRGAEVIYCYGIGFYKQEIMMHMISLNK